MSSEELSRTSKNKDIYDSLYENDNYDNISESEINENVVLMDSDKSEFTREGYRLREMQGRVPTKEEIKEKIDEMEILDEARLYDINKVIEKAKREVEEESDTKNTKYNILGSVENTDELDKVIETARQELSFDKEKMSDQVEEDDGINELAEELLGDTSITSISIENTVVNVNSEDLEELADKDEEDTFYDGTVSIDESDVEKSNKETEEDDDDDEGGSAIVKILVTLLVLVFLAVVGYLGYKYFM